MNSTSPMAVQAIWRPTCTAGGSAPNAAARSALARSNRWIMTRPRPLSSATHGRISGSAYGAKRRTARCATAKMPR